MSNCNLVIIDDMVDKKHSNNTKLSLRKKFIMGRHYRLCPIITFQKFQPFPEDEEYLKKYPQIQSINNNIKEINKIIELLG